MHIQTPFIAHKAGVDPARPILVHIGRIAYEKNIGSLLDVLAERKAMILADFYRAVLHGYAQRRINSRV